ncbi:MAG: hypothetical protein OEM26_20225, partial [Saprospiraceae bacterium]|nr:hypothetical protein [Saprospiraceae bacterium]
MSSERQLAAIMFTDIVGYTRLMGNDSEKALSLLRRNRHLQKPIIERHSGTWVKEIGDGILSQFNSAIDAVECAKEIQRITGEQLDAQLRIGIHLGDITFEEGDIFGDGVNVASRLEALATPGAIYISGSVAKAIRGNPEIRTEYLGEFQLRNVDYPVAVHAVQGEGLPPASAAAKGSHPSNQSRKEERKIPRKAIYVGTAFLLTIAALFFLKQFNHSNSASAISSEKSIAVLPFINESANTENEYFCNGIMTGILDHLAKIPDLRVVPRSSVEPFRHDRLSTRDMGAQLNANYLVDGSVQRIGDEAVISTQLIHAGDEQQIWSERYQVDLSEVLTVQSNITKAVAAQLEMILAPELENRIEETPTDDVQALEYYLQGNEFLFEANSENINNDLWQDLLSKAEVSFELALQRDSTYASCVTGLAHVHYVRNVETSILEENYLQPVLDLCTKAIELNPKISDSYLLRSMANFRRADMAEAEDDLDQAIRLNPNSIAALYHKAEFLQYANSDFNQAAEVLREIESRVSSQEDLWRLYNAYFLFSLYIGHIDNALKYGLKKKSIRSGFSGVYWICLDQNFLNESNDFLTLDSCLQLLKEEIPNENQFRIVATANFYLQQLKLDSALTYYRRWSQMIDQQSEDHWLSVNDWHRYGQALLMHGDKERGLEYLQKQIQINERKVRLKRTHFSGLAAYYDLAGIYAVMGEKEKAYEWLQKFSEQDGWIKLGLIRYVQYDIQFDNLRG